jgi:hypothetical protein
MDASPTRREKREGGMAVRAWSQGRKKARIGNGNGMNVRTWHGRCIHPKMYVVPEHIQAIVARANPRGRGMLVLTLCLGIALHFFKEPSYSEAREVESLSHRLRLTSHGLIGLTLKGITQIRTTQSRSSGTYSKPRSGSARPNLDELVLS